MFICTSRVTFNHKYPKVPAARDAIRMAIFDCKMSSGLSKASSVMTINIVNPMPARSPTPKTCFHLISASNAHRPIETVVRLKRKIPIGLPKISPAKIPILFVCVKPVSQPLSMLIQVLANANNGRIKNATGLCSQCCNL